MEDFDLDWRNKERILLQNSKSTYAQKKKFGLTISKFCWYRNIPTCIEVSIGFMIGDRDHERFLIFSLSWQFECHDFLCENHRSRDSIQITHWVLINWWCSYNQNEEKLIEGIFPWFTFSLENHIVTTSGTFVKVTLHCRRKITDIFFQLVRIRWITCYQIQNFQWFHPLSVESIPFKM